MAGDRCAKLNSPNGSVRASWRGLTERYDKFSLGTSALDQQQVNGVNDGKRKRAAQVPVQRDGCDCINTRSLAKRAQT
jgi:hypothetical protein